MMGSGHAIVMAFTMPLFAAVLGVIFLNEAMTRRRLAALALGAAGIAVLMSHDFGVIGAEPLGFALTLCGAALWAIGVLIQKHTPWKIGLLALTGWQILLGTPADCRRVSRPRRVRLRPGPAPRPGGRPPTSS